MDALTFRAPLQPLVQPGAVDCHVSDMTATVWADLSLGALQEILASHNQWLPIDGDSNQSLGSLVAFDSTGPLRLGYGAWRDLLLGAQFLNGRDELITAGGRTVKNVAGYDLTKFMVGQHGAFGRLITLTTRTYRRPAGAMLVRLRPDTTILSRLIPTSLRPQWAILDGQSLLLGYLGDESQLAFYRSAISSIEPLEVLERSLQDDINHRAKLWSAQGRIVFRAAVPPARLGELLPLLDRFHASADAAFGIVVGATESDNDVDSIRNAISTAGGTLKLFAGSYGAPIELSTTAAERQIIERLKFAFDPNGKLNPLPWQTH
jgi:hypothetical protein